MDVIDEQRVTVRAHPDVVRARQIGKRCAEALGCGAVEATYVATSVSEVARNIVLYAAPGEAVVRTVQDAQRWGLEVIAQDRGPGIQDLERVLQGHHSTGGGRHRGLRRAQSHG